MKKYYLLILTLALSTGALFGQVDGDYQTKNSNGAYSWKSSSTWEKYDNGWTDALETPANGGTITTNVYIRKNTFIDTDVTLGINGKIWITDIGASNTLFVGTYSVDRDLTILGEVDIEAGGYAKLSIYEGAKIYLKPGGKITDNSGGSITNNNSSGGLIIQSTLGEVTGSLITSTTDLNGTFEQYIPKDQWHFVSSPFSNTTAADFWDTTNDAYLREYNSPGNGWGSYLNVLTTAINVGEGYEVWQTANFDFSENGIFNTGTKTLNVSQGGSEDADWNLVGNPYPCGLDWDLIDDIGNAVAKTFYLLDAGSYKSYNGNTSSGTASHIIPAFQGFFVKSTGGGNILVKNEDKAHPDVSLYKSNKASTYTNHLRLDASFNGRISSTFSCQIDNATNGQDIDYDSPMLFSVNSSLLDIYTFAGDQKTTFNIYGEYPYVMEVAFKVPAGGGDITLTPNDFRNLDANLLVYLQDKETGDYINFIENPSYTFSAQAGDITDRIHLIFNNNVGTEDLNKDNIQIYADKNAIYLNFANQQFNGELKVYNLLGQTVFSEKTSNNSYRPIYLNQPSGYYLVELITEKENITQKVFIQQ